MESKPGTYALMLQSCSEEKAQIGRWRQIDIEPGYYIYVGSAFGPGGVRARVLRHLRRKKPRHWHIDYLRDHLSPIGTWYSHDPDRLEHRWAQALYKASDMTPVQGFGCSDCKCYSHLFHTARAPDIARFSAVIGGKVESWSYGSTGP